MYRYKRIIAAVLMTCLGSAAAVRHLHKHLLKQQQNAAAEAEAAAPEETETADLAGYYDHAFAWEERAEEVAETVKRLDLADGKRGSLDAADHY